MEEDQLNFEEFVMEAQPALKLPFDAIPSREPVPGEEGQGRKGRKYKPLPGLPEPGQPGQAPAPGAAALAPTAPSGTSSTKGKGRKRWLAGKGSAKRRKLEENVKLQEWLMTNGVRISDTADWGIMASGVSMAVETREMNENEISGRGLVASRDINLYEELARVPLKVTLSRESAREKFGAGIITEGMGEYLAISLQLIHEAFVEKEESFWAPYITILPTVQDIGSSFSWEMDELEMTLEGSPLLNMSLNVRDKLISEFGEVREGIIEANPERFPPDVFTLEKYMWAHAVLFSRVVRLKFEDAEEEFLALVPYVDLINHSPNSATYIKTLTEGVELPFGINEPERYIAVKSDRYYNKYEQIYLSYGPKSNAQLLLLYGFCLERHPADFMEVNLGHLLEESPMAEAKKRFMDSRKLERTNFPLYRDKFANQMMQFLRLLVLQPEDLLLMDDSEEAIDAALAKINPTQAFGELSERRALLCLKGICGEIMSGYPTTLEEDEKLIQDRQMFELLPKSQRNGIRVRYGEKLILRNTVTTIDRIMNNLGKLTDLQKEKARRRNTAWGRLGVEWKPAFKASNFDELMKELDI